MIRGTAVPLTLFSVTLPRSLMDLRPPPSRPLGCSSRLPNLIVPNTTMLSLKHITQHCSGHPQLNLVKAEVIPPLVITLNRLPLYPSSTTTRSDLSSSAFPFSLDCSPFLNWNEEESESENEKAVLYRSLVATLKLQPALDEFLEAKAVKLLKSVDRKETVFADGFLQSFASISDDSLTDFVNSVVVLLLSAGQTVTNAGMKMLETLIIWCSDQVRLTLIKAGLIPRLINTLSPLSLSFANAVDIHTYLMIIITYSVWLTTPDGLRHLEISDDDEQQAVHETVFKQVLIPSEKYICHLCVNRFSIIDGDQSTHFLDLLPQLLQISPYYQSTMDFVLRMPVVFTIPGCLTFFEHDDSIWYFLSSMVHAQREWNRTKGEVPQMGMIMLRMLRMEGIDDAIDERLQHDQDEWRGRRIVALSIRWNTLQGMNLQKQE
ncbi:hypothetical protein BLNAU_14390 [Blattamonas nauphoetae]|uniref:Uncharacterized protein n=1 Tax=Blattamonas nauphoetae TaxID=2049346 RepID=A0ABQ9XGC1_9EUKA|nr:hypothetical protein BLNAU_14390 [Blattamonas nauphoetae]